jgi:hypothetical protein
MIPFKGRLGIKQYIKDKPNKWGIKAFLLCDSQTAYCFRFEIYIARSSDFEGENLGLTSAVVLNLTKGMEYKGHIVYTDNFYTSGFCFDVQLEQSLVYEWLIYNVQFFCPSKQLPTSYLSFAI